MLLRLVSVEVVIEYVGIERTRLRDRERPAGSPSLAFQATMLT